MLKASEVYGWLQDNPVGAYIVVDDRMADHVMITQGGMMYKEGERWCSINWERMSPGTGTLRLVRTPYRNRKGAGECVYLLNT